MEKKAAEYWAARDKDRRYRAVIRRRFRQNRLAVWALRGLYVLLFVALFADFIANEKPIYCRVEGKTCFPVVHQYLVDLGWASWDARFVNRRWQDQEYESVWRAPIPYSYNTIDILNADYKGPFDRQQVSSRRFRHWLGTDQIGRDVAAGLVRGTRTAMLVGVVAMSIAGFLGIFLGSLAGFFGDDRLRISRLRLILNLAGLYLGFFYAFSARSYALSEGAPGREWLKGLILLAVILLLVNGLARLLRGVSFLDQKVTIPADLLVMRLIEIKNSIPGLLLILSALALIRSPNIFHVMAIIGLLSWTGVARFIRAELLRIRRLEYIEAAQALGFREGRILLRHAIPNGITPVLITLAFGIAGAVLLEAYLSFLGIGMPVDSVTWGTMLREVRSNLAAATSAWWIAVFPGLAIFFTVTIFNLLGEGLTEAIDPRTEG